MAESYEGRCHCGAIGWTFRTDVAPQAWVVRACQCTFCRSHGARCTSDPAGSAVISTADPDKLSRYRFGLRTADFLVCRGCGVYIGAVLTNDNGAFATLNVNALVNPLDVQWDASPVTYDAEAIDGRVARREARWTPVVANP